MRLLLAICLTLLASLPTWGPAWAAEPSWTGPSWTGQWDTCWREGGARMELRSGDPNEIGVELSCVLNVRTLNDERTDRTVLMPGVLRLAERMRARLSEHDPMPASALGAVAA